LRLELHLGL
jgi:hypothetical protein